MYCTSGRPVSTELLETVIGSSGFNLWVNGLATVVFLTIDFVVSLDVVVFVGVNSFLVGHTLGDSTAW